MKFFSTSLVLTLFCSLAYTEPFIIYDSGQGVSTRFYTQILTGEKMPDFRNSWLFKTFPKVENRPSPEKTFPIRTSRLTPRRLTQEQSSYLSTMIFPICVIGTDDLSRQWLSRNRQHLIEMNAQCLLVSAESEADARSLLKLTHGLQVYPAHGDAIADYFKIEHYPVLITQRTISQ